MTHSGCVIHKTRQRVGEEESQACANRDPHLVTTNLLHLSFLQKGWFRATQLWAELNGTEKACQMRDKTCSSPVSLTQPSYLETWRMENLHRAQCARFNGNAELQCNRSHVDGFEFHFGFTRFWRWLGKIAFLCFSSCKGIRQQEYFCFLRSGYVRQCALYESNRITVSLAPPFPQFYFQTVPSLQQQTAKVQKPERLAKSFYHTRGASLSESRTLFRWGFIMPGPSVFISVQVQMLWFYFASRHW